MATTHASRDQLPAEQLDRYEGRMTQFGDYNVAFESMPAGFPPDPRAAFRGLPDDACQSEHWGYLFKGRLQIEMIDGEDFVVEAGEAYYIPPGHRPQALEDVELVEFSPLAAFQQTMEQVGRNVAGMAEATA